MVYGTSPSRAGSGQAETRGRQRAQFSPGTAEEGRAVRRTSQGACPGPKADPCRRSGPKPRATAEAAGVRLRAEKGWGPGRGAAGRRLWRGGTGHPRRARRTRVSQSRPSRHPRVSQSPCLGSCGTSGLPRWHSRGEYWMRVATFLGSGTWHSVSARPVRAAA